MLKKTEDKQLQEKHQLITNIKKTCCHLFRYSPLVFHDKLGQNLLLCEQCQLLHMSSICTLRQKEHKSMKELQQDAAHFT